MDTSTTTPPTDDRFVEALRELIRTGVSAAPGLEQSVLLELPVVAQAVGEEASAAKRAHAFIEALRRVTRERLEGKEAQTAAILFGFEEYAGMPVQERYWAVAKLYNPRWTWENYRKEPLTRHLQAVHVALRREAELRPSGPLSHKVLIIKNITREGPGLLERILRETAVGYDVVDLHKGETFPDPTRYGALVVLGGPDSANDETDKIVHERGQIAAALEAGVPYLGICLGLQLVVKVAGGSVVRGVKEVGFRDPEGSPYSVSLTELALTALGKKDPLFLGLRDDFRVFQLHGETVEMTKSMQLLATGKDCRNQIVKLRRNVYGIQSHFELTREMLEEWLDVDPDLTPLGKQAVLAEYEAIEEIYTVTGLSLLRNFLHIASLV